MNLADALVPRQFTDGEVIIRQGDAADGMYFVEDGTARVVKVDANGEEKEVCLFNLHSQVCNYLTLSNITISVSSSSI